VKGAAFDLIGQLAKCRSRRQSSKRRDRCCVTDQHGSRRQVTAGLAVPLSVIDQPSSKRPHGASKCFTTDGLVNCACRGAFCRHGKLVLLCDLFSPGLYRLFANLLRQKSAQHTKSAYNGAEQVFNEHFVGERQVRRASKSADIMSVPPKRTVASRVRTQALCRRHFPRETTMMDDHLSRPTPEIRGERLHAYLAVWL
jgi:hypothetical protein